MAPLTLSSWLQNITSTPSLFTASDETEESSSYSQSAAYLSARILTIGGVTLLLIGLCCVFAVLLRFSRHAQNHAVQRVEFQKSIVLDQQAINKSFPIRIWPSQERLLVDKYNHIIATYDPSKAKKGSATPGRPEADSTCGTKDSACGTKDSACGTKDQRPGARPLLRGLGFMGRLYGRGTSPNSCTTDTTAAIALSTIAPSCSGADEPESRSTRLDSEVPVEEVCCSICLTDYVTDDRIRILPCGHEYHAECIDVWLTHKSTQCPLCKRDLLDDITLSPTIASADLP